MYVNLLLNLWFGTTIVIPIWYTRYWFFAVQYML